MALAILLQATAPIPQIVAPEPSPGPAMPSGTIPARAKAVVDHVEAIFKGDLKGSFDYVVDDVEFSVSDGSGSIHYEPGKAMAYANYYSMTKKGKLGVSNMGCAPDGQAVRCEFIFGTGADSRHLKISYFADGGPITRIVKWESAKEKKR